MSERKRAPRLLPVASAREGRTVERAIEAFEAARARAADVRRDCARAPPAARLAGALGEGSFRVVAATDLEAG